MTIEQLANESGVAFTTIRLYQHRGFLPPPERRGRVGYYDASHLARLRLIGELRERGFSLAAINELVEEWQQGRTLTEVLGLEATAAATLQPPPMLRLEPADLASRFGDTELTVDVMKRAVALGLVAFEGAELVVDPTFLDVGSTLVRMGVPADEILDEYEQLDAVATDLARRFTALFERHLWRPFVEAGLPEERLGALTEDLGRLTPLAETITTEVLRRALSAEASRFLAAQVVAHPRLE